MSGPTSGDSKFMGPGQLWRVYADATAANAANLKDIGGAFPRAVIFSAGGTLEVTDLEGNTQTIPDHGGAFVFPNGFKSCTGAGTATNFTVVW